MRHLVSLCVIFFAVHSGAQVFHADLDLSNLYGGLNAGTYNVALEIIPSANSAKAQIVESTRYDDGTIYCRTTAYFELGYAKMTIVDEAHQINFSNENSLMGETSVETDSEECKSAEYLLANSQAIDINLGSLNALLPQNPPKGYKDMVAYLTAPLIKFALTPGTFTSKQNDLNPRQVLATALTQKKGLELNYYVEARTMDQMSRLSLGQGKTPLFNKNKK